MSEREVRSSLRDAGAVVPVPPWLAEASLARGRERLRRRRSVRRAAVSVGVVAAAVVTYGVVLPGARPAEAAVSCYADRVVAQGHARIGRHGVRLRVHNATASVVRLVAGDAAAIVPPGRSAVDVALRPGRVEVSCDTGVAATASLTVSDPGGVYVDDRLSCATPAVRDLRADHRVERGDPVGLTFGRLAGLPSGASVEPAGYPGAAHRRVVRVRSGDRVVAVAVWRAMPAPGSWDLDGVSWCAPLRLL